MWRNDDILRLYSKILQRDLVTQSVSKADVKAAIGAIKEVYKAVPGCLRSEKYPSTADFNEIAYRCAYLFKSSSLHTGMVYDIMCRILMRNRRACNIFQNYISDTLNVCSLGGGPGTDIVAVLTALYGNFGFFRSYNTVIDIMSEWKDTFKTVVYELKSGNYGTLQPGFTQPNFQWRYLTANLLDQFPQPVENAIGSAHLITMIKFVSAAACQDAEKMIKKIFRTIQLGTLVLFIDNAAGGFRELVTKIAHECKLVQLLGPLCHESYINVAFHQELFDYTSNTSAKVTIHLMVKVHPLDYPIEMSRLSILPYSIYNDVCKINILNEVRVQLIREETNFFQNTERN